MITAEDLAFLKIKHGAEHDEVSPLGEDPAVWLMDPLDNELNCGGGLSGIPGDSD